MAIAACLVPLITAVIGAGLQAAAASQAQAAARSKTAAEIARQRALEGKAKKQYQASLKESTADVAKETFARGAAEKQTLYEKLSSIPLTQPVVSVGTQASEARDAAQLGLSNRGRAVLTGQDLWSLDQMVKNLRANQMLSLVGREAEQSSRILPFELQDASHAGDTLAGVGSLISTLGSLYGMSKLGASPGVVNRTGFTPTQFEPIDAAAMAGPSAVPSFSTTPRSDVFSWPRGLKPSYGMWDNIMNPYGTER